MTHGETGAGSATRRAFRMTPLLSAVVAALVTAAVGGAYVALASSLQSIVACVSHQSGALYKARRCARHDSSLKWNVTGPQGPQGVRGLQGAQGLQGGQGVQGIQGPAGPGAVAMHIDTTQAFANTQLAKIGPWTVQATCSNDGTTATLQLKAVGPADSVEDGLEINGTSPFAYSQNGNNMDVGNTITATNGFSVVVDNLDLFSPTSGAAHISMFKYVQGPTHPSGFRCKINGSGYQATT